MTVSVSASYKSPLNGHKNQIDLIDRPSPADHKCHDLRRHFRAAPARPCRTAYRPHDPIAPRPGRRRVCPLSRHPARSRPAVRPRMV